MQTTPAEKGITQKVASLYNKFPFPAYPLWARLKWSEAYTLAPSFSEYLAKSLGLDLPNPDKSAPAKRSLIIGSGDTQAVGFAHWVAPIKHEIVCNDLAHANIKRMSRKMAKSFWLRKKPNIAYEARDINDLLRSCIAENQKFNHLECYGVLHHLAAPSQTLHLLAKVCVPGTTMRLMVYNPTARYWLGQVSKVFRIMKLTPYDPDDLREARHLLQLLAKLFPLYYGKRVRPWMMKRENTPHFVDAFFHPRVLPLSYLSWKSKLEENGFEIIGLFDRNGELDDLPNPLWCPPTPDQIEDRVEDFRFEHNFELFCRYKPQFAPNNTEQDHSRQKTSELKTPSPPKMAINHLQQNSTLKEQDILYKKLMRTPVPQLWTSYSETQNISHKTITRFWHLFLGATICNLEINAQEYKQDTVSQQALRRLGRIGAILPSMVTDKTLYDEIMAPMEKSMEGSDYNEKQSIPVKSRKKLEYFLSKNFKRKNILSEKRLNLSIARISQGTLGSQELNSHT